MNSYLEPSYKILSKIFKEKSYSTLAINQFETNDAVTKIVYGVLERNIELKYIIRQLCSKKPQTSVEIVLKEAIYCILYMNAIPNFAIVNETVELTKQIGKSGVSGFVNAVLKKVANGNFSMPTESDPNFLSVKYSKPQWFVDLMEKTYGKEIAFQILCQKPFEKEHIRINTTLTTIDKVKETLTSNKVDFLESKVGGLVVKNTDIVKKMFAKGLITYQSPSSMLAVQGLGAKNGATVLDMCSAPGGKAIYIAELNPKSKVVACDLYGHRVELIKTYAKRMRISNVEPLQADATKLNEAFVGAFDYVLVDAPCSCLGTYRKHQDIFLNQNLDTISKMIETQRKILDNAVKYLKKGGILLYSTCTLTKEENQDNAKYLIENYDLKNEKMDIPFENDGTLQILPKKEYDGFFLAKFMKK